MSMLKFILKHVLVTTVVSLIFTACGMKAPIENVRTPTNVPVVDNPTTTVTVSNTPTVERPVIPLATASNAPTHVASPSPTRTPVVKLRDDIPSCSNNGIAIDVAATPGFHSYGTIFYHQNNPLGLYAISENINRPVKIELPVYRNYEYFGTSPNGKWLAVTPFEPDENLKKEQANWPILLISNAGQRKETLVNLAKITAYAQTINNEVHFIYILGRWLNDDLLELKIAYSSIPEQVRPISIQAYFNPFTGDWLEKKQIPKLGPYQWIDDNWTSISPDMTRALYLTENQITIWDFQKQKDLKTLENLGVKLYPYYDWSPDSQWALFYSGDFKTILFDRNGENIIDLNQELHANTDVFLSAYEGSWSPDSRFLDIYTTTVSEGPEQNFLMIFDLKKKQYVFQCEIYDNESYPHIQWSPNSGYVIPLVPRSVDRPIRIIDINQRVVYQLPQDGNVIGWSDRFTIGNTR